MPHKHKRKRDDEVTNYDLPPSSRAKPLPVLEPTKDFLEPRKRQKVGKSKAARKNGASDDTPKAFARLMAWQSSGKRMTQVLDDGTRTKKKAKKTSNNTKDRNEKQSSAGKTSTPTKEIKDTDKKVQRQQQSPTKATSPQPTTITSEAQPQTVPTASTSDTALQILPGESLAAFSVRVNQSLPLTSLPKHNTHLPSDIKPKANLTKHNKRLARMQAEWRATDQKLKDKREEEEEEQEERREEEGVLWSGIGSGKKARRRHGVDVDDDPWKELEKRKRAETKPKNLLDVVQAPPVLKKVRKIFKGPQEEFDVRAVDRSENGVGELTFGAVSLGADVGSVPRGKASLRRREELNATRQAVIEAYRRQQGERQRRERDASRKG